MKKTRKILYEIKNKKQAHALRVFLWIIVILFFAVIVTSVYLPDIVANVIAAIGLVLAVYALCFNGSHT
jgi:hypothetical protein